MTLAPKTLATQLVAILVAALACSQLAAVAAVLFERRFIADATYRAETFHRVADVAAFLRATGEEGDIRYDAVLGSSTFRVSTDNGPSVTPNRVDDRTTADLARLIPSAPPGTVRVSVLSKTRAGTRSAPRDSLADAAKASSGLPDNQRITYAPGSRPLMRIAVQLSGGRWLNVLAIPPADPPFGPTLLIAAVFAAGGGALAAVFVGGRLTRPIRALARAADHVGVSKTLAPLKEEGPEDLRLVMRGFNGMAARVDRMLEEQQQLLRAVGHDLRTPLASLRLRLEFVEDDDLRRKMIGTVEQLEDLSNAAIEAARTESEGSAIRRLDLVSLVGALCDDAADMGRPVRFRSTEPIDIGGRSADLRRAVQNLIDNAVVHGGGADVLVSTDGPNAVVEVLDRGPGLPSDKLDKAADPFWRASDETSGHGLGLSIVRSIATRHDGTLRLENRPGGGLRALLILPRLRV